MMLKEQCKEMRELYEDLLRGNSNLRREIRSLAHSKDDASSKLLELEEVGRLKIKELQALKNHFRMLQKEECILANHLEDLTGTLPHLSPEHMIQCQLEISQEASSLLQATNKKMLQQTTDKPQAEKSREERQVKGKEKMHLEEKMIRVVPPTLAKTQRKVEIAGTTTMKSSTYPMSQPWEHLEGPLKGAGLQMDEAEERVTPEDDITSIVTEDYGDSDEDYSEPLKAIEDIAQENAYSLIRARNNYTSWEKFLKWEKKDTINLLPSELSFEKVSFTEDMDGYVASLSTFRAIKFNITRIYFWPYGKKSHVPLKKYLHKMYLPESLLSKYLKVAYGAHIISEGGTNILISLWPKSNLSDFEHQQIIKFAHLEISKFIDNLRKAFAGLVISRGKPGSALFTSNTKDSTTFIVSAEDVDTALGMLDEAVRMATKKIQRDDLMPLLLAIRMGQKESNYTTLTNLLDLEKVTKLSLHLAIQLKHADFILLWSRGAFTFSKACSHRRNFMGLGLSQAANFSFHVKPEHGGLFNILLADSHVRVTFLQAYHALPHAMPTSQGALNFAVSKQMLLPYFMSLSQGSWADQIKNLVDHLVVGLSKPFPIRLEVVAEVPSTASLFRSQTSSAWNKKTLEKLFLEQKIITCITKEGLSVILDMARWAKNNLREADKVEKQLIPRLKKAASITMAEIVVQMLIWGRVRSWRSGKIMSNFAMNSSAFRGFLVLKPSEEVQMTIPYLSWFGSEKLANLQKSFIQMLRVFGAALQDEKLGEAFSETLAEALIEDLARNLH
ncbi:uncharacterized protein LOC108705531 [Xenopus laevis]|uniref:Uncharacterized protein LOC108705531 n=1 Tax=Xenopus laevis TaxID=8355 RepID=A0A8J1KNN1_XENLA|nr:uncharacterized protein LOC108705531 [Xenopus laevis]